MRVALGSYSGDGQARADRRDGDFRVKSQQAGEI